MGRMLEYKWESRLPVLVLNSESYHIICFHFCLVFYCCITNYQKLSGLKQHSFILAHVPWVRGLGWACAQGLRRLESRHQTDDVFTWVLRERITATFFRLLGGHSLKLKTRILIFLLASHWGSLWAPEAALTACPIHRAFCSPAMWWSRPAEESLP